MLTSALVFGLVMWWINKPKEWSRTAITAKPTELIFQQMGEELHFRFRYSLTNNTGADYTLSGADPNALMRKLPEDSSLAKVDNAK